MVSPFEVLGFLAASPVTPRGFGEFQESLSHQTQVVTGLSPVTELVLAPCTTAQQGRSVGQIRVNQEPQNRFQS